MKKVGKKSEKKEEVKAAPAAEPKLDRSARVVLKYVRISPRKVRPVLDAIRKKPVRFAWAVLDTIHKKAARLTEKALKSAVANAKVLEMDENRLYISDARADGGPTLKRFLPRSMGRADRILKRTTHLTLVVKESDKKTNSVPQETQVEQAEGKTTKSPKKKVARRKKTASAGAK